MGNSRDDTRLRHALVAAVYLLCALYLASIVLFALGDFVGGVILAAVASAAGFGLNASTRLPRIRRQMRELAQPTDRG